MNKTLDNIKERHAHGTATYTDVAWLLAEVTRLSCIMGTTTAPKTNTTIMSRTEQIELITAAMIRRLPLSQESTVRQLATIALDVLAGLSCALPSAATIESWYDTSAMVQDGEYMLRRSLAVEHMLRSTIAPILVAQASEVAELRAMDAQYKCARSACVEAGVPDMPLVQDMVDALRKQRDDALYRVTELESSPTSIADKDALEAYRSIIRPLRRDGELAIQTLRRIVAIANDWREDGGVWKKRIGDVSLTAGRDITIHSPSYLAAVVHGNTTISMCGIASIDDAKKQAEQIAAKHFSEHIGATQ